MSDKIKVARLSIWSNALLIALKLIVGLFSGSVSIISEAVHSAMDLLAALITYVSVKISALPADDSHPYGHEKVENISGAIEALLILAASAYIIKEASFKITHHRQIEFAWLGCIVMFISAIVNTIVSKKLCAAADEHDSVAIAADALHLKADVITSLGVGAGLLALQITGLHILDPLIAIAIALFIIKEAVKMLIRAFGPLMDAQLDADEVKAVQEVIALYKNSFVDFHDFRSRKAGNIRHIDLHVTTPEKMTVKEYHKISDRMERDIASRIPHAKVLVHAEPCDENCPPCSFANKSNCK
jgi:cation diffusion facilitator family transporter